MAAIWRDNDIRTVALRHEEYHRYEWGGLVLRVAQSPANRIAAARAWLEEQRLARERAETEEPRRGWTKNQERDRVILNCRNRGLTPELICQELDNRTVPTPLGLHKKNIHRWADGWQDPKARNVIQQLFSKVPTRKKLVKPSAVSESFPNTTSL